MFSWMFLISPYTYDFNYLDFGWVNYTRDIDSLLSFSSQRYQLIKLAKELFVNFASNVKQI